MRGMSGTTPGAQRELITPGQWESHTLRVPPP